MCTSNDLMAACMAFQQPNPLADVRTSPWLRVDPCLHTISSATERLRLWAEAGWRVREAQRPESGPLRPDGSILADKRHNPFAAAH